MDQKIDDILLKAIEYSRDERALLKTGRDACLKLMEEVGELAEALLYEDGLLPHKAPLKEPSVGEAADIILMVMQVLANHYKISPKELLVLLKCHLETKLTKWNDKVLNHESKGVPVSIPGHWWQRSIEQWFGPKDEH